MRFASSRALRVVLCLQCAAWLLHSGYASAQQLVDRVVARVGTNAVTLTELQAARGFGIVNAPSEEAALQQMIDRQLLLIEVSRFPPDEPTEMELAAEVARERAAAGGRLAQLMASTGTDEARLRDLARDTLRIDNYIDQRFGTAQQVTQDEAALYYGAHPEEFRRNGAAIPFDEALPLARELANAERRRAQLDRWVADLRGRTDISIPTP
jgi:hypothetical protein